MVVRQLPQLALHGRRVGLSFASEAPDLRSAFVLITPQTTAQVIVHEGDRLLLLPRVIADRDTLYIDTAGGRRGPAPITLPLRRFAHGSLSHLLDSIGIAAQEHKLHLADTLSLSLAGEATSFWLSGVGPFRLVGNGKVQEAMVSGERLSLQGHPDEVLTLGTGHALPGGPRTFLLTLARATSLVKPRYYGESHEALTLVVENSPEIEINVRFPRDGWISVTPALRWVEWEGVRPSVQPEAEPPITLLNALGFGTARFDEVPGATLVIGSKRDTVDFRHAFEVPEGIDTELLFTPIDGLRYEGTSNAALVNGENRVTRRTDGVPAEVLATLAFVAFSAVGTIVVWLLRLNGSS